MDFFNALRHGRIELELHKRINIIWTTFGKITSVIKSDPFDILPVLSYGAETLK